MLAPFVNLFIRLGISPDAITLVGTAGVVGRRADLLPAGSAAGRCAVHHRLHLQRPDRRGDGPQDRPHVEVRRVLRLHARPDRRRRHLRWPGALLRRARRRLPLPVPDAVLPGDGRGHVVRAGPGGVARHGGEGRDRRARGPHRRHPGDDGRGGLVEPADPDGGHASGRSRWPSRSRSCSASGWCAGRRPRPPQGA